VDRPHKDDVPEGDAPPTGDVGRMAPGTEGRQIAQGSQILTLRMIEGGPRGTGSAGETGSPRIRQRKATGAL
jgi:hypothetical protein